MKKHSLDEQELQNLSKLLLSTDAANIEIGLQLVKSLPNYINFVCKELVLISQLSWNDYLQKIAYELLKETYSAEQLEDWNESFKIFHVYENLYDYDDFKESWHLFEKHEEIRPSFVPFLIQNSDYIVEYITLAECVFSYYKKKLDWAERYYLMALLHQPNNLGLLTTLADLYKDGYHDYPKALDCYNKILSVEISHYDALEAKALLYFSYLKEYDKAVEVFQEALIYYPNNENLKIWLADIYMTQNSAGSFQKGKNILLSILKKTSKNIFALTIYANQLWITEKKPEEAKEVYFRALDIAAQDYNVWGNLAELYDREFKKYEIAQEYYAKTLALYMDDVYHLCNYISLLTIRLNELEQAKDYYEHLLTVCYKTVYREPEMNDEQWRLFQKAEQLLLEYISKKA